jgi:putative transposase
MVEYVDALRNAVRVTQAERPFQMDGWVMWPDHRHAAWTLPEGVRAIRCGGG